ncbi:MAG: histidine kinase [Ferruginibacter sp.]
MRFFYFILTVSCLLFFKANTTAQMRDSFYNYLHTDFKPKDKHHITHDERLKMLNQLGGDYVNKYPGDVNALVDYARSFIDSTSNKEFKVKYTMALASFYINRGNYEPVIDYYRHAIIYIGNDSTYKTQLSVCNARLGCLFAVRSMPDTAIEYIHKAMDITNSRDSGIMKIIYNGYELIYQELHLYEKSINYVNRYIEMLPDMDKWSIDHTSSITRMITYYNLLYSDTKEKRFADSSRFLIRQIFEKQKKFPDAWYAECYFYLGQLSSYQGDYKQAVRFYDSSFLPQYFIENSRAPKITIHARMERAICLLKLGHTEVIKTLEEMDKVDYNTIHTRLSKALHEHYKSNGEWKQALEHYEQYIKAMDSLAVITTRGKIFEANQKYSVAQKEIEIKSLENTNLKETESKTKIATIAVVAVAALLLLVMSLYSANKRQQAKRLEERQRANERRQKELKEERERISQELHDDLGTGLTSIRLLTKRMMATQIPEQSTAIPNNIYKISGELVDQMGEIIWLMNHMDDTLFGLLGHLRLYMAETLQRTGIDMQLQFENNLSGDYNISGSQRRNILLMVKEAFNNAVKYSGASKFSLVCSNEDNAVKITLGDNGQGFDINLPRKGNGVKNIHKRAKTMNGTVTFETGNGTLITINIPMNKPDAGKA